MPGPYGAALLAVAAIAVRTAAQNQQAPTPPAGRAAQGPRNRAARVRSVPEQQRPLADPRSSRRKSLYDVNCAVSAPICAAAILAARTCFDRDRHERPGRRTHPAGRGPAGRVPACPTCRRCPRCRSRKRTWRRCGVCQRHEALSPTGVPAPGTSSASLTALVGNAWRGRPYFMSKCASCPPPAATSSISTQCRLTKLLGRRWSGRGTRRRPRQCAGPRDQ